MKLLISNSKTSKADLLHPSVKNELLEFLDWGPSDEERLSVLLEAGIDVNTTNSNNTSLVMLAMLGLEEYVRTILEYGPDLSIRNTDGDTVITMINEDTTVGSIKRVLRLGAQLDVVDNDGYSPLIWSITAENWDVFDYLMTFDAVRSSLNLFSKDGTALHFASYNGNVKAVEALLDHGADIDLHGGAPVGTPLMEAILGKSDAVIQLLIQKGAQLDQPAGLLYLPIFAACLKGSRDLVRSLINDHSVSEDVVDRLRRRPVHLSCYNNLEVLEQLDPPRSDFAARDCLGRVPLHYASLSGDIALMEVVLERSRSVGVGIDIQDDDGWTPLLWAARASSIVKRSDVEAKQLDAVSWLISQGADVTVQVDGIESKYEGNEDRWTAADIAQYHGAEKVADLLKTHIKSDEKEGQRSWRIGQVGAGYCTCCLLVRHPFPLTNPSLAYSFLSQASHTSFVVFKPCIKVWLLTLCSQFMAYISLARLAGLATSYASNASVPKPYFILHTLWNNAEARKPSIPRRKCQRQRKYHQQAHLWPVKIPMMR